MASFAVQSVVQQLGNLLVEEVKYLCPIYKKVEILQAELVRMSCFVQNAEDLAHHQEIVRHWVDEIINVAYEAEAIVKCYVHEASHHRKSGIHNAIKWFPCLILDVGGLHEVGSKIDDLRARISELATRLRTYGIQSVSESSTHSDMLREQRWTYPNIEEYVVGLEDEIEKVVRTLVNTESQVLGVYGMGGLGKTTFSRKVYSNTSIKQHFSSFAWVYVSQKFERRRVFAEILIGLDGEDARQKIKDMAERELLARICDLLASKKCLVVLDDIWTTEDWKLINPAFASLESSPSKILLTTRNEEVFEQVVHGGYFYALRCLNKEEAWRLLQQEAFYKRENEDVIVQPEMEAIGKEMLKRCGGLPLAIKVLGGILATKETLEEWKVVKERMASYLISDTGEGREVSLMLEMSFYQLPFELKPCFLHLGKFPEDYEILAERLYCLWEAEGIISATAYGAVSDVKIAEIYLNQLVKRSMVQVEEYWPNGRIKRWRLHDVMRDVCLRLCKELNFSTVVEHNDLYYPSSPIAGSSMDRKRIHHCAIHWWDSSSSSAFFLHYNQSNARYLRSLLVFPDLGLGDDETQFLSTVVKSFPLLQVLDLNSIRYIPEVIGELIHLRYLSLRDTTIEKLPSCIFDLKYLETLILESFVSVTLPNEFWKMERLRYLYLPDKFEIIGSEKLTFGSSDHQLSQMQILRNFNPSTCQMEGLFRMTNLRTFSFCDHYTLHDEVWKYFSQSQLMTSRQLINCLELWIDAGVINEDPVALTSSEIQAHISELRIDGTIDVNFRHDQVVFPRCMIKLTLCGSNISEEGILELEKLPHLKELLMFGKAIRGNKMSISDGGFPHLVKLKLFDLEEVLELQVGKEALPNLCDLVIFGCSKFILPEGLPSSIKIHYVPLAKYDICAVLV